MRQPDLCPACGGTITRWRTVQSGEPSLGDQVFTLLRCRGCGSAVTLEPAPAQSHDAGAYGHGTPRLQRVARPVLDLFDRQRLALIARPIPPPAFLLDAGAGRGRFVAAARRAGYDAVGIEPSNRGARAAAELGVPVSQTTIERAEVTPGSLDVITLWHVLEHLDDPAVALRRMFGWLRPGGALLVGVPNLNSLQARVCPGRWYHLDVPRHRVHYTPFGLSTLLQAQGFRPIRTHNVLLEHNPFGMWQSLVNRVTRHPSYLYNLLKRNAPVRSVDLPVTVGALALAPVAVLAELSAGLIGRGGSFAILAKRAEYD